LQTPGPQDAAATATAVPENDEPPARLPVVGISEQIVTPEIVAVEPTAPDARPAAPSPRDTPERAPRVEPSPPATASRAAADPGPTGPAAPPPIRTTDVATLASSAPAPIDPVTLGTARVTPPPAAAEPAIDPAVESTSRIRSVLSQYEAAYSGLDAAAARAVWPAVDEQALARAFNNLASQRISLEQCDVSINGPAARAECRGQASWVPKVGGGGRTEARRWTFDLRQAGANWQIVRADAR
jgi:hypothetical protein